jgi:hypothetical protein
MVLRGLEEAAQLGSPTLYRNTLSFDHLTYSYLRLLLPLGNDRETADRLLLLNHCRYSEQHFFWEKWEKHWEQQAKPATANLFEVDGGAM